MDFNTQFFYHPAESKQKPLVLTFIIIFNVSKYMTLQPIKLLGFI